MIDPETNSLLVLYDDAQAIYRSKTGKRGLDFGFASVGIQAQGRTTILKLNYRNTIEVLSVAREFATELLSGREAAEDGVPVLVPKTPDGGEPFLSLSAVIPFGRNGIAWLSGSGMSKARAGR